MCTVTFVPTKDGFFLTSCRDEKASRNTLPPEKHTVNGIELIYPKDEAAGGTWIASDSSGRTACLLNGAFVNHIKRKDYVKSRGLILLESFQYKNVFDFSECGNLENVEPFTLLTINSSSENQIVFFEFRWDGVKKYLKKLNTDEYQIWSSATLYTPEIQAVRLQLFKDWIIGHSEFEDCKIYDFHNKKHGLKSSDDILMKGDGDLMTLSISQVEMKNSVFTFRYSDLLQGKKCNVKLNKEIVGNV